MIYDVAKDAQRPLPAPLLHVKLLCCELVVVIVVAIFIVTKHDSLTNEIDCMGATAEASVGGDKFVSRGKIAHGGVVGGSVVKDRIAQLSWRDLEALNRLVDNLTYLFARVRAREL